MAKRLKEIYGSGNKSIKDLCIQYIYTYICYMYMYMYLNKYIKEIYGEVIQ
jgi:hypothetical protein